jgi:lysophospholipase L1-like esterase
MVMLYALLLIPFLHADNFGQLGPHGMHANKLFNPQNWIAIVGDSGVTGAASRPDIEPTLMNLAGHMMGFIKNTKDRVSALEPLTRVPYSRAEYRAAGNPVSVLLLNMISNLALRLDTGENGFGYQVGRKLGVEPSDIVLVGQDGVLVSTIGAQFGRIFEMQTKTLPPVVLLSFTANDLCDVRIFERPVAETAAAFTASLKKTWIEAKPYLKAHAHGTKILVLAPFDVANVITNTGILSQKTNVEGQGEITCGQLRHGDTSFTIGSWFVLRMLNLMCPSVTQTHVQDVEHLERLRQVQAAFGQAWQEQIAQLNSQFGESGISWKYVDSVREFQFSEGDVGNDCFHPSAQGHAKIAELVLRELQ